MKIRRKQSLQQKLAMVFAGIIVCIMIITLTLHAKTVSVVRQMTYESMNSQAEYYQQTFETEIQGILNQQLDFFNNRKLPFLANPVVGLNAYEEREAVLNVQERIRTITEVSSLIESGVVYIPKNNYYISEADIRRMTETDWEDMGKCLQNRDRSLQFDGENFYSVRTGETGNIFTENPDFVFVITFSSEQVKENLALLNASDESFTFHSSPQEVKEHATYIVESIAEAIQQII